MALGVNVNAASKVFTLAIKPLALHTPVVALKLDVTAPDVPVFKLPAFTSDSVIVAVVVVESVSLMTMFTKFLAVSSV